MQVSTSLTSGRTRRQVLARCVRGRVCSKKDRSVIGPRHAQPDAICGVADWLHADERLREK
eukprot:6178020-Pleurochrysis_carterae.AAC.1